jgi:hypothetical protein
MDFNANSWMTEAAEIAVERKSKPESVADIAISFQMPVRTARCRFIPYRMHCRRLTGASPPSSA